MSGLFTRLVFDPHETMGSAAIVQIKEFRQGVSKYYDLAQKDLVKVERHKKNGLFLVPEKDFKELVLALQKHVQDAIPIAPKTG